MNQNLLDGFPVLVALAFLAMLLLLLAVAPVLAALSKPAPIRAPRAASQEGAEGRDAACPR